MPDSNGPQSIEVNVNGYIWTAIIESWQTQSKFPADVVTMTGHSRTMLLNAPYRMPRDYAQAAQKTAQQLMNDELQFSGFTLDYGTTDWLVPGGTWTYQQQTPIGAIHRIASAAGAIVQSHPFNDVLQIRPRWPTNPWDWASTSPDKTVLDDFTPQLTAVDQTSGTATYQIAGLPLWPATATDMPGLISPLHLVQFVAASGWKGQVASVQINVQMQSNTGSASALVVAQDIKLDSPPADPIFDYVLVSGQQVGVSSPIIRNGRAGTTRLPQIVDALITDATVQRERGRNAIAGGGEGVARANFWRALTGTLPGTRYIKGSVTSINADGSLTVATTDGGAICARPLPGQTWAIGAGVFVQDGRVVDTAPTLTGVTQYV